jgi:anti-sigma B factor antagonist
VTPPVDPAEFQVHIGLHRDCVTINVAGDLDYTTADRLRSAADEAWLVEPSSIVLDLAAMTFCDSMGIGTLLYILKGSDVRAVRLALAGLGSRPERLLRIAGVLTRFERFPSVTDALSAQGETSHPLEPA